MTAAYISESCCSVLGGLNRSMQHLDHGGVAMGCSNKQMPESPAGARRQWAADRALRPPMRSPGRPEPLSCGAAGLLAADRIGSDDGRGRGGRRRVMAGRVPLVPPRWWHAADQPGRAHGPLPVARIVAGEPPAHRVVLLPARGPGRHAGSAGVTPARRRIAVRPSMLPGQCRSRASGPAWRATGETGFVAQDAGGIAEPVDHRQGQTGGEHAVGDHIRQTRGGGGRVVALVNGLKSPDAPAYRTNEPR